MTTDDRIPGDEAAALGEDEADAGVEVVADVLVEDDGTVVDLEDADRFDEPGDSDLEADDAPVEEGRAYEAADLEAGLPGDDDPVDSLLPDDPDPVDAEPDAPLEVIDAEDLLEEEAEEPEISPYDRPGRWYVVHTQSGYEKKVKQNLEARIGSMNMEERIYEVVIPMEDVVEFKNGKKVVVQKKVFPGYLLVRCELDDDSWYVIRNTPGVTGFVGQGAKPSPLPRRDVETFLQVKAEGEETPKRSKPRLEYEMGETVRVKEGPFADFSGEVVEINEDQLKVKVLVNIFGRETPVELEFAQVAKL